MKKRTIIQVGAIAFFLGLNIVLGSLFLREAGLPIPVALLPLLNTLNIISTEEKLELEKSAQNPFFTQKITTKRTTVPTLSTESLLEGIKEERTRRDLPILAEHSVLMSTAQSLADEIASQGANIDSVNAANFIYDTLSESKTAYNSLQHFTLVGPISASDVITAIIQEYADSQALYDEKYKDVGVGVALVPVGNDVLGVSVILLGDVLTAKSASVPNVSQQTIKQSYQQSQAIVFPYISDDEVLSALNSYRAAHSLPALLTNQNLCQYAEKRVKDLVAFGGLDNHEGFKKDFEDYENRPDSIKGYPGGAIGENLAYQYCKNMTTGDAFVVETGTALIEWCFDSSTKGHREAQLSTKFTAACVRHQDGLFVVIFGE